MGDVQDLQSGMWMHRRWGEFVQVQLCWSKMIYVQQKCRDKNSEQRWTFLESTLIVLVFLLPCHNVRQRQKIQLKRLHFKEVPRNGNQVLLWKQKCKSDRDKLNVILPTPHLASHPGLVPCVFTGVDMHAKWLCKVAHHTTVDIYTSTTATKQLEKNNLVPWLHIKNM